MVLKKQIWGKLPDDIYREVKQREWLNLKNLKQRLLNERPFPIKVSLSAPSGKQALDDLEHLRLFIDKWKQYPNQQWIEWQDFVFRTLSKQKIPTNLVLNNISDLLDFLGKDAKKQSQVWQANMQPLLNINRAFYPVLVDNISILSEMNLATCITLAQLIQQLSKHLGKGLYLRALPLKGVDTKFLEINKTIISALLDVHYSNEITLAGGLLNWLDCLENPKGWLLIKPLCLKTQTSLAGLPILQLDCDTLKTYDLPADNILVVENIQSGLALPKLNNTIAVIGGGHNINWLSANWLANKSVAYWGDIDSWGLKILGQARTYCPHLESLMMNEATLLHYQEKMVHEPTSYDDLPTGLTQSEMSLFNQLKANQYIANRLEQERLPNDYVNEQLFYWLDSIG